MRWLWIAAVGATLAIACDGDLPTTTDAGSIDGGLGGSAGTAGDAAAGMAGAGGSGGACPTFTFLSPQDGATLSEADDTDRECLAGFAMNVQIATNAAEGTEVFLTVGGLSTSAQAHGAVVEFFDVPLAMGTNDLEAELTGGACSQVVTAQVLCASAGVCQIASPSLDALHPVLNGVLAPDGDRASPLDFPYRTPFDVRTSAGDGEIITLEVDGTPYAAATTVLGGTAHFPGVELTPDGNHQVRAECHTNGVSVLSAPRFFTVDSVPPELTVSSPVAGEHFGPDRDADLTTLGLTEIDVCMTTESGDAVDLPPSLGATQQQNFCVAIDDRGPSCEPALSSAGDNACVRIQCPDQGAFGLTVTLRDRAGNISSSTIPDVSCSSNKPTVQITSPLSGTDETSTNLLAAGHSQTLRDQRADLPGAQWLVRACTDTVSGSATLIGGVQGAPLSTLAGPVPLIPAQPSDNCPSGLFGVARFVDATLPESEELLNGNLDTVTELRVEVTDALQETAESDPVTLWVDSFPPSLSIFSAVRCGDLVRTGASSQAVTFQFASASEVSATLSPATGPDQLKDFPLKGAGLTEDDTFDLEQGENILIATNTEPSGNEAALQSDCIIELGDPPIVAWTTPANDALFNVATDGNPSAAGWQGALSVTVSNIDLSAESPPVTVEFFRNDVSLGAPVAADTVTGVATLSGITIDDGEDVELKAETSVTSKGVGHSNLRQGNSIQLLVDTIAPAAPTNAQLTLLNRRQTSFRFGWTAPSDGGAQVGGYQVRVHTATIDAANFDNPALSKVTFAGNTGLPGTLNVGVNINNRLIERDYYAAVVATDAAGNRSPLVAAGPIAGHFNVNVLPAQHIGEGFGMALDGAISLNDDTRSDLVVGTEYGNRVYVWMASATGDVAYSGAPNLVITGPTGVGFGNYAVAAGDLNADGRQDLVVGAPFDNPWGSGLVYVFLQPDTGWPSALNAAAANATVAGDPDDSDFDYAFTGGSLGRLGDFDGDGLDDVAIGLPYWGPDAFTGYVAVLRGSNDLSGAVILPDDVGTSGSHRVTAILGETALQSGFSGPVIGLGPFYPDSGNSLLVAGWQGDPSRVYALAGSIGNSNGILQASAANHTAQSNPGAFGQTLALLGVVGGNTGVGVGQPKYPGVATAQGRVHLYWGTANTGPFATSVALDNANTVSGDLFGTVIIGSAIPGGTVQGSFLGASSPDVALAGSREQGQAPVLYFLEGQTIQALLGQTVDIGTVADASLDLSALASLAGWQGTSPGATPIADVNGDGFMDLAIGEHDPLFSTTFNGRVAIIW